MTVNEAIETASALRPHAIERERLVQFLSELEGRIAVDVRGEHPQRVSSPVRLCEPLLSVPAPFDRLYWCYLLAMIDLCAGDSAAYALSHAQYCEAMNAYACWYQRTAGGQAQ